MKRILVTVQDRQFDDAQIKQLQALLREHYACHVSRERLTLIWTLMPAGQAYTNYAPSRSSIVTMECADGFPQAQRVSLLQACARDWTALTGQHPDELMISLIDQQLFNRLMASNRDRLSATGRLRMGLHMLTSLLGARLRRGFLAFNPNL